MRVFIAGASGFIGGTLLNYFSKGHETYGSFYSNPIKGMIPLDITDKKTVKEAIISLRPEVILHPAANPNVEYCEEHPEETRNVNVEGSKNLMDAAKEIGAKFVFFSSDYIFDGTEGPYSEGDPPNPINEYGRQKLAVENLIKCTLEDFMIVRSTIVYGWERHGKNFAMRLIRNLRQGTPMKVPCDQIGSPTYADNMAQVVKELIESDKAGVYNVAGSDLVSRYIFAKKIAEVFELDMRLLIPVTTEELGQKAKRPLNAGMRSTKVQNEVSLRLLGVKEGLEEMKQSSRDGCL